MFDLTGKTALDKRVEGMKTLIQCNETGRTIDLATGHEVVFNGSIINYFRNIGDTYIEVDAN